MTDGCQNHCGHRFPITITIITIVHGVIDRRVEAEPSAEIGILIGGITQRTYIEATVAQVFCCQQCIGSGNLYGCHNQCIKQARIFQHIFNASCLLALTVYAGSEI